MHIIRVKNTHEDFVSLTQQLDTELNARYGRQQSFYDQHNRIDPIDTAVVGYCDGRPAACGCFKAIDDQTVEIKRMFVVKPFRRQGLSIRVLEELESWSASLGFRQALLETGKGQPEAIGLYRKYGYVVIDNYGPYEGVENSVCMKKKIA